MIYEYDDYNKQFEYLNNSRLASYIMLDGLAFSSAYDRISCHPAKEGLELSVSNIVR
jgi:hypothetical protein